MKRYEDIICSIPEYDSDDETYHVTHLWCYTRGKRVTYTTCDSDGSHEPCTAKEADKIIKDSHEAWLGYSHWVIENKGEDPCGEFMVKRKTKVKRNIVCTFGAWVGASTHGFSLDKTLIGGKTITDWRKLPVPVVDFLMLDKVGDRQVASWGKSIDEAREFVREGGNVGYFGNLGNAFYLKLTVEWDVPRPDHLIRKDIIAAARAHIGRNVTTNLGAL